MITSVHNERIRDLIKLSTVKGRKEAKQFIVEGPHLVFEARKSGYLIEAYTTDEALDGFLISESVMKKICNTVTPTSIIGVCKMFNNSSNNGHILALDSLQDPGNVGSLMRSAVSFGFNTILLGDGCVDIYNDKVIRSSQGAFFKLSFIKKNLVEYLSSLEGYTIYSTNVVKGKSVSSVKKTDRMVLILGNEGSGISDEIDKLGFDNLYIPLKKMESLNVSVAGGILMYELTK